MKQAYILSACRTPIGKFLGSLSSFSATELGTVVVREAIRRSGVPSDAVEEVIMGNVISAGLGQNPARQAALGGGVPAAASALTINKVCGSGLKAVGLAAQSIRLEEASLVAAGGMESMSNAPYLLTRGRTGYRLGHGELLDAMIQDGLWDVYEKYHMGCTGEVIAEKYNVCREVQDEYAVESHRRAVDAIKGGRFAAEIVPIAIPQKRGDPVIVDSDEGPRADASLQALGRLKAAFKDQGTVTAGNSSQLSDGAAALIVGSEEAAKRMAGQPIARIVAFATSGIEPSLVMMAPLEAIQKVRDKAGWNDDQIDLYELNEAFAVQAVALTSQIPLDPARVNVNGGAIALGHPIGASGARVLVTLLHALRERGGRRGVASLCLGGGNAVAMAVEMV